MKKLKDMLHHRRRVWMIAGAGTVLLSLLFGYIGYSVYSWQGLGQQGSEWQKATRNELSTVMSMKAGTAAEKSAKITQLHEVVAGIRQSNEGLCDISMTVSWQTAFKSAKQAQDKCQKLAHESNRLVVSLDRLVKYLENEASLARILENPSLKTDVSDEKAWEASSKAWHEAAIAVKAMKKDTVFTATQKVALAVVDELDGAWQQLLTAHAAQKKTEFASAQGRLEKAYGGLGTINDTNDHEFRTLVTEANARYAAAL